MKASQASRSLPAGVTGLPSTPDQIVASASPVSTSGPLISITSRGSGAAARARRSSAATATSAMSRTSTIATPTLPMGMP